MKEQTCNTCYKWWKKNLKDLKNINSITLIPYYCDKCQKRTIPNHIPITQILKYLVEINET